MSYKYIHKAEQIKSCLEHLQFPFFLLFYFFYKIKITFELHTSFNDVNDFVIGALTADFTFGDVSLDIRLVFSLLGDR